MIIDLVQEKKKALKTEDKQVKQAMNSVLNEIRTIEMLERTPVTVEKQYKWFKRALDTRVQSAKIYQNNNRMDLYNKELAEIKVAEEYLKQLQQYMPKQLSEEQIEKIINTLVENDSGTIGKVMKYFAMNYPNQNKAEVSKIYNKIINKG